MWFLTVVTKLIYDFVQINLVAKTNVLQALFIMCVSVPKTTKVLTSLIRKPHFHGTTYVITFIHFVYWMENDV